MKIIKKYFKDFLIRGLVAMGFGPIVLAIIYGILSFAGVAESVETLDIVLAILSISLLAFFAGALNQLYQIEEIPISLAITGHGILLYIVYLVVYLINGWLKDGIVSFVVFTIIFIISYLVIWLVIYLITKKNAEKVNNSMKF